MEQEPLTIDDYVLRFYRILTDAQTIVNKLAYSNESVIKERDELRLKLKELEEKK